ncbi:MAG: energy-coupling factor transporter transmembrane protein EcfT, partial [Gemmataceae bacterium]|nr:energy-coupling factor transporter transmembrane protein EcfT [Gemmataceae bacterium]
MSTAAPPAPTTRSELRIISHSGLFYWWPVWAIGYLMAIITLFQDQRLAVVPDGTKVKEAIELKTKLSKTETEELKDRVVWVAPNNYQLPTEPKKREDKLKELQPHLHVSPSKNPGVIWIITLLLVIAITNIPLRGLWSVVVIIFIVMLALIFALANIWDTILEHITLLDIRITTGGYVLVSTVLLILWLFAFLFFDKQIYIVFTPGQFRVRQEIGEGETAHDTAGMTVQKQRSDLFRHWILGLGSGDLIVKTSGAHPMEFHLPNVLFLGRRLREIEE